MTGSLTFDVGVRDDDDDGTVRRVEDSGRDAAEQAAAASPAVARHDERRAGDGSHATRQRRRHGGSADVECDLRVPVGGLGPGLVGEMPLGSECLVRPANDMQLTASRSRRQMIQRMGRVLRREEDGRAAHLVIVHAVGTVEDPAIGAHEGFPGEVLRSPRPSSTIAPAERRL